MKGLIIKDFLAMKKQFMSYTFIYLIYGGLRVSMKNLGMLAAACSILAGMMPYTSLMYDEQYHWDGFACTLPVRPADVVISKYIFGAILLLIAFAANIPALYLINTRTYGGLTEPMDIFITDAVLIVVCIAMQAVTIPMCIKFGVKKMRIALSVVCIAILMGAFIVMQLPGELIVGFLSMSTTFAVILVIAIIAGLYFGSLALSVKFYKRREY